MTASANPAPDYLGLGLADQGRGDHFCQRVHLIAGHVVDRGLGEEVVEFLIGLDAVDPRAAVPAHEVVAPLELAFPSLSVMPYIGVSRRCQIPADDALVKSAER
jgi:hypothetical protein